MTCGDKILAQKQSNALVKCLQNYNKRYPEKRSRSFDFFSPKVLSEKFHFDCEPLKKRILECQKNNDHKNQIIVCNAISKQNCCKIELIEAQPKVTLTFFLLGIVKEIMHFSFCECQKNNDRICHIVVIKRQLRSVPFVV